MSDTAGLHAADINNDNMARIGNDNETMRKLAAVAEIKNMQGIVQSCNRQRKAAEAYANQKATEAGLSNER